MQDMYVELKRLDFQIRERERRIHELTHRVEALELGVQEVINEIEVSLDEISVLAAAKIKVYNLENRL